jgi:4-diphosphocytidyl-2-C-methyl-D-erythritol kinase
MHETAYAKINLALHVRAREPDGYHRIETIFAFAEDGDRLSVEPGEGLTLRIEGRFAGGLSEGTDNLVVRAAQALANRFAVPGAALTLDKRLPVASGIGGGSADAAAALRLLSRFWGLTVPPETMGEIARSLGADVPACLLSRTARGSGRGDVLEPVEPTGLAETPLLLVNPGVPVSTADVFRAWDGADRGPLPGDPAAGRNDLEPPARRIAPVIDVVLAALHESGGATLARMSGSGATCFALYDSDAARDAASAVLAERHPGWWRLSSRIR